MGRPLTLLFFFSFFTVFIGLSVAADWSILNFRGFGSDNVRGESLKRYCESWRMNVEMNNVRWFEAVPQECVSHIEKYMTSSQYEADSVKAFEEVKLYLATCCCGSNPDGKDAWIFDIDDTLLSTIPYYKKHGFGREKLNATAMEIWMAKGEAPALKPTLEIFNEIRDQGLKIFLISSRRECIRSETVDNLFDVGYHGWATLYLRSPKDELVEVNKYKALIRQQLVDGGYRLKGIIGDHWSSFEGNPIANRAYKLPNSIYYV